MSRLPATLVAQTCESLVIGWGISPELAVRLLELATRWEAAFAAAGSLQIISGYRSVAEQLELEAQGRPAADPSSSTHTTCPATGADLRLPVHPAPAWKLELGRLAQLVGLRWGGGSPLDADGLPTDWNHVDLGPRRS